MTQISIVVPVLNDAAALSALLDSVAGQGFELVVADGGSCDNSVAVAREHLALVVDSPPGRGMQVAAGIAASSGEWLWILHADTHPSAAAIARMQQGPPADWGRFNVDMPDIATIAWFMNVRSRITRICTGDQGMYTRRSAVIAAGGMPELPLMEDIELSRRLKQHGEFCACSETIRASDRRWRTNGVVRTVVSMWWFRLRYFLGVPASALAREYYGNGT